MDKPLPSYDYNAADFEEEKDEEDDEKKWNEDEDEEEEEIKKEIKGELLSTNSSSYSWTHHVLPKDSAAAAATTAAVADPPRVAVCIVGAIRSFNLPPVYDSIRGNFIYPLTAAGYDVDVHVNLVRFMASSTSYKGVGFDCSKTGDPLPSVLSRFRPKTVLLQNDSSCRQYGESCYNEVRKGSFLQLRHVDDCFAAAQRHFSRYKYFVRARPDAAALNPVRWPWIFKKASSGIVVVTADKPDAAGSDVVFAFSAHTMRVWWNRGLSKSYKAYDETLKKLQGGTLEYYLFPTHDNKKGLASTSAGAVLEGVVQAGDALPVGLVRQTGRIACWSRAYECKGGFSAFEHTMHAWLQGRHGTGCMKSG